MKMGWERRIRQAALAVGCAGALSVCGPLHAGWTLPLAQAPAAPAPVQAPANVTAPPRYYVLEGIVIVLLFAGAVFAVCRTSGRT